MIRFEQVSKRYGRQIALHPTSLSVPEGRCLALIGPSGSGKSTLLRLAMGLLRPDTGRVCVGETPVTPETTRALRLRMGYVQQDGALFPHLTAAENIALMARHLRWSSERIRKRIAELAEMARLPEALLERYPAQLSGGQRQRVGLMRALMLDPEVLLMDEPLGALDPMIRSQLQDDLRALFRRLGKTVLLVTHDLGEAAYLADTLALMREGRIVQTGSARDLVERPAEPFVAEFVRAQRPHWLDAVEGAR